MEGVHAATLAMVEQLATESGENESFNLFPGFVSPADIRWLKETVATP
jgi:nitrogenase molybdenum-iron protein NifN